MAAAWFGTGATLKADDRIMRHGLGKLFKKEKEQNILIY